MCFVLGVNFRLLAVDIAPLLSSNIRDLTAMDLCLLTLSVVVSLSNILLRGINSLSACDKMMYSASVVLKAVSC